jgi:ABC-type polysaccharide/polyol phosphate transport system ATPase subunit
VKENTVISIEGVSKTFLVPHEKHSSLKQSALNMFSKKKNSKLQTLKSVSLDIKKGEFFGIMGRNGCGKSTLLKIIAGIYQPSTGKVVVDGRLAPFIELGVGFNMELTGRENIFLAGIILGMERKEIEEKYQTIVDFSELEDFMDQKLKNYSSGMQVRLAFSIAIQAQSDVLLIDEVLAVGDANFQRKCFRVFKELKAAGKTIVFVSHAPDAVRDFCDRVALIEKGELIMVGDPTKVTNEYLQILAGDLEKDGARGLDNSSDRWGDGKAKINKITIRGGSNKEKKVLAEEPLIITVEAEFFEDATNPIFGLVLKNEASIPVFQSNTMWGNKKLGKVTKGRKTVTWELYNYFDDGRYTVSPAIAYDDGLQFFDWWENGAAFESRKELRTSGIVNTRHKIIIQ